MTALLDLCRMTRICHMTSLFLIVMTCIAYMRPVYSVDPRQVDGKSLFQSLKPTKCSVSCVSTKVKPVCGTNGITYPSRCDLKRAKKCDGQRVRMKHWGECESETVIPNKKCLSERRKSTKARRKNPKVFVPTCKRDGTYNEIQCHATSRYCWCVNEDGKHRRGTSVIGGRPRCKGKRGGKPKRKRGCTPKDRHNFNTALIKVFEEEYLRVHPTRPPDTAENADKYGTEETIVLWKFAELDLNKDGILKFKMALEHQFIKSEAIKLYQRNAIIRTKI
ncbi:sparc-related modular calcium-binding protein [Plakobranchus ocellatus]|uniref:Sparc-related modular calcium-binding protein n=1 Tax=Plakobranchus ocellatus TaxID=259542 RepID=A0AAV4B8Z6_9GAST|nr:sparc-related modular calcium-binding protein [Plakobranchus ocellatus]